MASKDMHTATTLTFAAAILKIITAVLGVLFLIGTIVLAAASRGGAFFLVIFGVLGGLLGLVWFYIDYFVIYKRMKEGKYKQIADTMLIAGILQLFLGGTISGILILIAWFLARG